MTNAKETDMEAAKGRHPSGGGRDSMVVGLTAEDRCDRCGAAAAYRVARRNPVQQCVDAALIELEIPVKDVALDFCLHHWRKNFPSMITQGWAVIGGNPFLLAQFGGEAS